MAFYKKKCKPVNGLWYPQSILVGKPAPSTSLDGHEDSEM